MNTFTNTFVLVLKKFRWLCGAAFVPFYVAKLVPEGAVYFDGCGGCECDNCGCGCK